MSEYMDDMFEKAVKAYREDYDNYPISARRALMMYLGAKEIESSCTLCTRECPVRNDGIIDCEFENSGRNSIFWSNS